MSSLAPTLTPTKQVEDADCCIAALATLLNKPYSVVFAVASRVRKNCQFKGLTFQEARRIAKKLGHKLKVKKPPYNLKKHRGIAYVTIPATKKNRKKLGMGRRDMLHAVVNWHGWIYDPDDSTLWAYPKYQRKFKARFGVLLVRR